MTAYYAVFQGTGSNWDTEKGVREQPFWDEHARFIDELFEAGFIVIAGPFADHTGSLLIVNANSSEEVRAIFKNDPWAIKDVLKVHDVKEWTIFLDSRKAGS